MPAYNHDKYVEQAIASVLSQDGVTFELIVIDDGSTDDTARVVRELNLRHDFKFISRPNKGLIATIKEGLSYAKAEFISFVASDDFYLPGRLKAGVAAFASEPSSIQAIAGKAIVVNSIGQYVRDFEAYLPEPIFGKNLYNELLILNWIPALAVTYRASFLRSLIFPPGLRIEDWFMLLTAARGSGLRINNARLSGYRKHAGNSVRNWAPEFYQQQLRVLGEQFPEMKAYQDLKKHVRAGSIGCSVRAIWRQKSLVCSLASRRMQGLFQGKVSYNE